MKKLITILPSLAVVAGCGVMFGSSTPARAAEPLAICDPVTSAYCATITNNKLDVNATVNASIAGFTPAQSYATLTATGSSARHAIPTGSPTVVVAYNTGTTAVSCILGDGSVTAVANEDQIAPGGFFSYTVGANADLACIDQTGSASNVVVMSGGSGVATGSGGGGGSGGGAITAASGSYASGALASGSIASGAAASGALVDVLASQGTVAAGTAATKSTLGGCIYNSSAPSPTTGQGLALQCASNGALNVASGVAQGATSSGQTVSPIGVRTLSTTPTDTTAQTNMPVASLNGATVTSPYALADSLVSGTTAAMTGTTSTSLIASPGGSLHNYITQISCVNSHATVGTFVTVQDGSGGTALATLAAAAVFGGETVSFPAPLRQPTAATALYVADVTTGANVICSATGFKAL